VRTPLALLVPSWRREHDRATAVRHEACRVRLVGLTRSVLGQAITTGSFGGSCVRARAARAWAEPRWSAMGGFVLFFSKELVNAFQI